MSKKIGLNVADIDSANFFKYFWKNKANKKCEYQCYIVAQMRNVKIHPT